MIFPGTVASDATVLGSLLNFLGDPSTYATRLKEIKQAADTAQAKLDQQDADKLTLDKDKADFASAVSLQQSKQTELNLAQSSLDKNVQQYIQNIKDFETYKSSTTSDLSNKVASLAARESAVSKKENAVAQQQYATQLEYTKATNLRQQYEAKIAQLKAAMS